MSTADALARLLSYFLLPACSLKTATALAYPSDLRIDTAEASLARPLLSVVICTLNEHEAIGGVIDELQRELDAIEHEIIVVDDSSDERTAEVVRQRTIGAPNLRLLRRERGSGLSSAAIAGWDSANGSHLAIMDGDGQHDPRLIAAMFERLAGGRLDLVVASRYLDSAGSGLSGYRHLLSRGGVWLTGRMLGMALADPLSGCFVMSRAWYREVRPSLSGLGFKILIDVVASTTRRPRATQLPTALRQRVGGVSKLDLRVAFDLLALLIEKRSGGRVRMTAWLPWLLSACMLGTATTLAAMLQRHGAVHGTAVLLGECAALLLGYALNHALSPRSRRPHAAALPAALCDFVRRRAATALLGGAMAMALHAGGMPTIAALLAGLGLGECWYNLARARRSRRG